MNTKMREKTSSEGGSARQQDAENERRREELKANTRVPLMKTSF